MYTLPSVPNQTKLSIVISGLTSAINSIESITGGQTISEPVIDTSNASDISSKVESINKQPNSSSILAMTTIPSSGVIVMLLPVSGEITPPTSHVIGPGILVEVLIVTASSSLKQ